ncbi:MAG: type III-B CRISPR-associated protein Cas10/Cmr2 [Thermodesulfobacteriota bacterium]
MNEQQFWLRKILQFLHDPPGKPFAFWPKSGGHTNLAKKIYTELLGKRYSFSKIPDLIATGADRPLLTLPWGQEGGLGTQYFHIDPTVTHPLARTHLKLPLPDNVEEVNKDFINELAKSQVDAAAEMKLANIADAEELQRGFLALWRRFREEIINANSKKQSSSLWEFMPADSRCPDHSIWEHNRLASALSFVPQKLSDMDKKAPDYPWLFSFALQPVQEFLRQARKSQDLWVGSMIIAELSWAAMEPIIKRYGPDVFVYPDLRANPRADIWLYENYKDALPDKYKKAPPGDDAHHPATRAGVIPHTFIALLPYGSKVTSSHLQPLEELAQLAIDGVSKAWETMSQYVQKWMEKSGIVQSKSNHSAWNQLWDHGHKHCPLTPTWVASPWPVVEKQEQYYFPGGALLAQDREKFSTPSPSDAEVIGRRKQFLGTWLPESVWTHYEYVLSVFGRTNNNLLVHSGFAYGPAHHRVKARHSLRRRYQRLSESSPASYEKCTLCHTRPALHDAVGHEGGNCESIRETVRKLWRNRELDPEEQGNERLCSVCSVVRFLVRSESVPFNTTWVGAGRSLDQEKDRDNRLRPKFPSTVAIAAQNYLEKLARGYDEFSDLLERIVNLHGRLNIDKSSFPSSLPRLARALKTQPIAEDFLKLDPQLALFPEMVESKRASAKDKNDPKVPLWNELKNTVKQLRERAAEKKIGAIQTQIAVLVMDGDEMSKVLLGDPARIKSKWKDVIHPRIADKILESDVFRGSGWPELLNLSRTSGPALQAFISRALADFSHHIAPWVVEQEFSGRLIYCGGDDLLALLPAREALAAATRLQELFSAAWVIDTEPEMEPWSWLLQKGHGGRNPEDAENRFHILKPTDDLKQHSGRLLPMLGKHCSLSAGIMYGHFKTRMGLLLEHARIMLDQVAKEKAGRSAAGMGHFSRSGPKTKFGAKWQVTETSSLKECMERIVNAFDGNKNNKESKIPASLPYKLTEYTSLLNPFDRSLATGGEKNTEARRLMKGLLNKALDGEKTDKQITEALLALWESGGRLVGAAQESGFCMNPESDEFNPLDGIFLCRYLAGRTEES